MTATATPNPWYREPWPWILMAGPATVIVAGFITLWLAITSFDGLVVDDYYKRGLAINQALARTTAAENLGLQGEVEWNPLDGAVAVKLERTGGAALPDSVRLTVSHATRAGHDQIVMLARKGDGRYAGRVDPLGPGRWQIMIEDTAGQWRVKGGLQAPQERTARLAP